MGTIGGSTFGIGTPFSNQSIAGYGVGAASPVPHLLQLLQIVPQQLQQVQALQQQQFALLQQLLSIVPSQLQQLQQLIQVVPHQVQQLQQPYQPFGAGISGPLGFGLAPQAFGGGQTGHVM